MMCSMADMCKTTSTTAAPTNNFAISSENFNMLIFPVEADIIFWYTIFFIYL